MTSLTIIKTFTSGKNNQRKITLEFYSVSLGQIQLKGSHDEILARQNTNALNNNAKQYSSLDRETQICGRSIARIDVNINLFENS